MDTPETITPAEGDKQLPLYALPETYGDEAAREMGMVQAVVSLQDDYNGKTPFPLGRRRDAPTSA